MTVAKRLAAAAGNPLRRSNCARRSRQARKTVVACDNNSAESVATVTASTAHPDSHMASGRFADALREAQIALRIDPSYAPARVNVQRLNAMGYR